LAGVVARAEQVGGHFAVELAAKDLRLATSQGDGEPANLGPGAHLPVLAAAGTAREAAGRHPRADLRAVADPGPDIGDSVPS
ncbi:MAG: hypothetical protein ACRCY9_07705, partial [Phycicoccus sp.]